MTQMLASVMSVNEALLALELGADIIDLKNPSDGALGALPLATQCAIVAAVGGRCTISATIGETPNDLKLLQEKINTTAATGVDIVKIGIARSQYSRASWRSMAWQPISSRLVAVLFADHGIELSWVEHFAAQGFYGVMLDTENKNSGGLRYHCDDAQLRGFVEQAHAHSLRSGLAGSLRLEDIESLLTIAPDYLGFRGALCRDQSRVASLDREAFGDVRARIPRTKDSFALSQALSSVESA